MTLEHVEPAVWRRFTLPSGTTLPELHEVLQDVLGWEDRHLHAFVTGNGQRYEMQVSLDEWDHGEDLVEDGVRVDELLGDGLEYEYDFGDGWKHQLVCDSTVADDGPPKCLAGERACPPEDCGGPHGYEELLATLADPSHPEHDHMKNWAGDFASERFDVAEANRRIAARQEIAGLAAHAPKLLPVLDRAPLRYHPKLIDALRRVDFGGAPVDPVVAAVAMEKLTWMLGRLGSDGHGLTTAGYLAPKDVVAIRDELDWGREWIGGSNREVDNQPVHWLRHAMTNLGLARVLKGRLVRTRMGAALAEDPVKLWVHATSRMPVGREDSEKESGVLLIAAVAAGMIGDERNSLMLQSMEIGGWRIPDRQRSYMQYVARPTLDLLTLIGAVPWTLGRDSAIPEWGRRFAADALVG